MAKEITKVGQAGLEELSQGYILKTRVQRIILPEETYKAIEELGESDDPRTVLLHGPPGIGKTTLCYKLLYDITRDKLFADQKVIPYLIRLRDINTLEDKLTFTELLLEKHGRKYGQGDNWMQELYSELEAVENRIVILIDGYDESQGLGSNTKQEYLQTTSKVNMPARPQQLAYSLIEGSILPNAKVFVTSRSYAIDSLKECVQRVVELEGFTEARLQERLIKEFGDEVGRETLQYLKEHPRLLGLCYVPRHTECFISHLKRKGLSANIKIKDITEPIPESMAHLILCLITQIMEESCHDLKYQTRVRDKTVLEEKKKLLTKLSKMAHDGLYSPEGVKQVFTEEEAKKWDLAVDDLGSSIMGCYELLWEDAVTQKKLLLYTFPHLVVQEWCTGFNNLLVSKYCLMVVI